MPSTAAAQQQKAPKSAVTLKGSAKLVSEFFHYGIHSILYQRGIYPPESFCRKQEYGLTLLVSTDDKVNAFLKDVLAQIQVLCNTCFPTHICLEYVLGSPRRIFSNGG